MSKKYFSVIVALLGTQLVLGQTLVDTSFEWQVLNGGMGGYWSTLNWVEGDSAYGGHTYHKVWSSNHQDKSQRRRVCLFREDSTQVIGLNWDGTEYLMYDYSLEVGDTVDVGNYGFEVEAVVVAKTTEMVNNTPRVRLEFEEGEVWIEGIGELNDPWQPMMYRQIACAYMGVQCVRKAGNRIYPQSQQEDCEFEELPNWVGTEEETPEQQLQLYPNPASDYIYLSPATGMSKLRLFDATGRVVLRTTGSQINVSELADGHYYLIVDDHPVRTLIIVH